MPLLDRFSDISKSKVSVRQRAAVRPCPFAANSEHVGWQDNEEEDVEAGGVGGRVRSPFMEQFFSKVDQIKRNMDKIKKNMIQLEKKHGLSASPLRPTRPWARA